jgi:arginine deiminase
VVNAIWRSGFDLRNTSTNDALDADDVDLLMIIAENNTMKVKWSGGSGGGRCMAMAASRAERERADEK